MVSTTPIRSMPHSRARRPLARPPQRVKNQGMTSPQRDGAATGAAPAARAAPALPDPASWIDRDAAVVWHGFTQMASYADNAPLVIDRAEGRELIAADGTR